MSQIYPPGGMLVAALFEGSKCMVLVQDNPCQPVSMSFTPTTNHCFLFVLISIMCCQMYMFSKNPNVLQFSCFPLNPGNLLYQFSKKFVWDMCMK